MASAINLISTNHGLPESSFIPNADNQSQLRDALGRFGTGVTIVTAPGTDGPAAITVNSFSSVSLAPPLVLWCIERNSSRFEQFNNANEYSIHVLGTAQQQLCMEVARNPQKLHNAGLRHINTACRYLMIARYVLIVQKRHHMWQAIMSF